MSERFLVTSTSELKLNVVREFAKQRWVSATVTGFNCDGCELPPQPIHGYFSNKLDEYSNGHRFAKERIMYAQKECTNFMDYDYVVSIENAIDVPCESVPIVDKCFVVIYHKTNFYKGVNSEETNATVSVDEWYELTSTNQIQKCPLSNYMYGLNQTLGELLHNKNTAINPKNWFLYVHKFDRSEQIRSSIESAFESINQLNVSKDIVNQAFVHYHDFPKPGVLFQDFLPILRDSDATERLLHLFHYRYKESFEDIDVVVGLESRGFLLGVLVARELDLPFVPVRKAGKLPGPVFSASYGTEYSKDTCEIQQDCLKKIKSDHPVPTKYRVLIVDDLIATGGSMQAAVELVEKCGGIVADCVVLKSVPELKATCDNVLKCNYTVLLQ